MSRALRDIPAIRALAEREAQALYRAVYGHTEPWERVDADERECWIGGMLDLLCDLSRSASRDAVARLGAEAVGIDATAGVTMFGDRYGWGLSTGGASIGSGGRDRNGRKVLHLFYGNGCNLTADHVTRGVAGLDTDDLAEALAIIADAVLP